MVGIAAVRPPTVTLSQIDRAFRLLFMTIRSIVLFAHLVGVLALFAGLAIEWLCLERLCAADESGPPRFTIRVLERLPRVTGIAGALILLSGIALGARIGALHAPFVGLSFVGIVVMSALGGIALRPLLRVVSEHRRTGADAVTELRQIASRPFVRVSLRIRVWIGLAIVYLMVAKPDLFECAVILAIAAFLAVVGNMAFGRWTAIPLSTEGAKHR